MAARLRRAVGAIALAVACGDPNAPIRRAAYEFRDATENVTYHWPPERLPVRYYVSPSAGPVQRYLEEALIVWESQFLYGEFRGILVTDSAAADVVVDVSFESPPDVPLTNDPPVDACSGVTDIFATPDLTAIDGQMLVNLVWDRTKTDTDIANCLARVTMHEIGHTLGLLAHDSIPGRESLMASFPRVRGPTADDRVTAQVLYHTPSDLLPAVRPQ